MAILINSVLVVRFGAFSSLLPQIFEPILGAIILILSVSSVFVIRNLYVSSIKAHRQKIEILRLKNIEEQNRIYRQHRHDLYNHLTIISGLAQMGKLDSLLDYLASYLDNFNKSIVTVDTGLKELDILFFAKISEARNRGIDVRYDWSATVHCGHDKIIKVVAILANALDNAIQGCLKTDNKEIKLKITDDPLDYVFEIANTYDPNLDLKKHLEIEGFTTKHGSARGEGLSIIRKTVINLRGKYNFVVNDGYCYLKIELPKMILEEEYDY